MKVDAGMKVTNPIARLFTGKEIIYRVPNRWWIRLAALQALAFVVIFTVAEQVMLSGGWRLPWQTTSPWNGLQSMPGWFFDLVFARSNNTPNGAHLISYVGIPILGLYTVWKTKDLFMGLLIAAFYVALHESLWELAYYFFYSQYLTWSVLTNVLKDVSFASMVILFLITFWKYPGRKISMSIFKPVVGIYIGVLVAWALVPHFFGYGWFPITTINNFVYGHGVYSETQWWSSPWINAIEDMSWFDLFLMMLYVVSRWKPNERA